MIDPFDLPSPEYAYVIAEIGNNHQGSLDLALQHIEAAKWAGADAVKLQKRSNKDLFIPDFYNSPYENENSFGPTYGTHREAVELSIDEIRELQSFSKKLGLTLFSTPFDFQSLIDLETLDLPFYKLASADIVHLPLVDNIVKSGKNIIISTGSATFKDIDRCLEFIDDRCKVILLHCTAAYPAPLHSLNLRCITQFIDNYSNYTIGLSDHENGIDAASVAYMLGARVFEKHFTLDRAAKGTDNAFSLEPIGLQKLVRNLRRIPIMLGSNEKLSLDVEAQPIFKMRKSIVYAHNFSAGTSLGYHSFEYRCPGIGLPPYEVANLVGRTLAVDVVSYQTVVFDHLI